MYEQSEYWRGVNCSRAREAWASFLSEHSWDAFFTATSGSKDIRRHPLSLCQKVRDCIYSNVGVTRLFVAAEEFRLGEWHCHGLVKWHDTIEDSLFSTRYSALSRGLSKIGYCLVEPANSTPAVARYVSKYVIKTGDWEYIVAGTGWNSAKDGS